MLKFLRKYNTLILVVGGSLLMVVFLLQPVLTRLGPSQGNQKVATIGPDAKKVSAADIAEAGRDLRILEQIVPIFVMGLDLNGRNKEDHYYLLLHEAERAGLVGGVDDGALWIPDIAQQYAVLEQQQRLSQQGIPQQYWPQFMNPQTISQRALQIEPELMEMRTQLAQRYGFPIEWIDQALANARGISRLRSSYQNALRYSAPDALESARELLDSALADLLVLPSKLYEARVGDPTEEQLRAQFEEYRSFSPGEGDFGFGYLRAPAVKLEFLILDPRAFGAAVEIDPVEVNKRWKQDRVRYPGEFADEKARIEAELRSLRAEGLMVEADQVIRREALARTRTLPKDDDGFAILPDDWAPPSMSDVAQAIVSSLSEREGVTVPLPEVQSLAGDWLTQSDIAAIEQLSRAQYRFGSVPVPVNILPLAVRGNRGPDAEGFPFEPQVGVPIVENPAQDAANRRFYITILAARPESPPDSIDSVREQVALDVQTKLAFEALLADAPRLEGIAAEQGLEAVAALFADQEPPPAVNETIVVTPLSASRLNPNGSLDRRANDRDILGPIVDAARERLDPTAPIGSSALKDSIVSSSSKATRSLVLARLTAYRPVTIETYRTLASRLVRSEEARELAEATEAGDPDPFSYDALVARFSYVRVKDKEDADEPASQG